MLNGLMTKTLSLVLLLIAMAPAIVGQVGRPDINRADGEDKTLLGSIRGRVVLPDGNYISKNVKVTLQTMRDTIATIYTDNQGQFEFPDLIPGNYQVEVDPTDREHFDVSNEPVQVFKGAPS